jgi:NADPH:quinone reductase-like Zn-dependent oxidoreductase
MRAIAVSKYGAKPTVMDLPDPRPAPGQVLIKVGAAGVNPMDRSIADGGWSAQMDATFPLILGADAAGVVEALGTGASRFSPGDKVFGQLLVPPLGSTGTYAERVVVAQDANLAPIPVGMELATAAALPTAGGTALQIFDRLGSLGGMTMLLVGADGGVGSFLTQIAASAGANVIAVARARAAERLRTYGVAETVDYTKVAVLDDVHARHPDGIDILVDVANDAEAFAALATLVRKGGTALTTRYVADADALASVDVTGVNFAVAMTPQLLTRLAGEVVAGRVTMPPIREVKLDEVPDLYSEDALFGDGKTVIDLGT